MSKSNYVGWRIYAAFTLFLFLFVTGFNWTTYHELPLCQWDGVFGRISWCYRPPLWQQRFLRAEALREQESDPLYRAVKHIAGWF